jgi:hypothetical protein
MGRGRVTLARRVPRRGLGLGLGLGLGPRRARTRCAGVGAAASAVRGSTAQAALALRGARLRRRSLVRVSVRGRVPRRACVRPPPRRV